MLAARERGRFTSQERNLASSFNTCAINEHATRIKSVIPKNENGERSPPNEYARRLGQIFYDAVCDNDFSSALGVLAEIRRLVKEQMR